jgi:signal transduction histidine kinase
MYLLTLFVQNAAQAIRNAELSEKLIQKEKLSAVGQVIGMVMHDLRAPINNIKFMTEMMRDEGEENEYIDMIDRSAEQASEIFEDFLDFIKEIPVQKRPVDAVKIISQAVDHAKLRNNSEGLVIHSYVPEGLVIQGDESKLRRVVSNLVNNAEDVLHDNAVPEATIDISCWIEDKNVMISISDNGPGIPKEIMSTLFDPFVTQNKTNGTGLGLAIVKQYVNAHGGKITVSNNNGALFTIALPL